MATLLPFALIVWLILIKITNSINCGTLQISCNTGDLSCYSGPCAQFAPLFIDINRISPRMTPTPTFLLLSSYLPPPIPTPQTTSKLPSFPTPNLTTTTNSTLTTILSTEYCGKPGDLCTSAHERHHRCCDGHHGGTTRCKYTHLDHNNHKIGICCIKPEREGCIYDEDCCGNPAKVCVEGVCVEDGMMMNAEPQSESSSEDTGDNVLLDENKKLEPIQGDVEYHKQDGHVTITLSKGLQFLVIVLVLLCIVINGIYCCCKYVKWHKGIAPEGEGSKTEDANIDSDVNLDWQIDLNEAKEDSVDMEPINMMPFIDSDDNEYYNV